MKAVYTNKFTIIQNPSPIVLRSLNELLSYKDKSKQYQLRKMQNNPNMRNSSYFKQLQTEAEGCLLKELPGGHVAFNSGMSYLVDGIKDIEIEDRRSDTGKIISLPWKKKPFDLRPYQEEAVLLAMSNWRGIINFATGLGKTLTAIHLIKRLKRKALIIVPSDSIAKQFYIELVEAFGEDRVGFIGGGKKKIKDITIGIAASVIKNLDELKKEEFGVIINDEVHHMAANTFYEIAVSLGDVGRVYGLTATDYRSDGKDIMIFAGCGNVIIKRDTPWGIANGFLAKPKFIIKKVNTIGTDHSGDKLKNYKTHILNNTLMKDTIYNDIKYYLDQGLSVLCLVDEVAHGTELSTKLGIPFANGQDKASNSYVDDLNSGKIKGLIGTDGKISEGTDTRKVDVLILANFVASKGPVVQALGRGLRLYPGKTDCIVLDYIPIGSKMLVRHAESRISWYLEINNDLQRI